MSESTFHNKIFLIKYKSIYFLAYHIHERHSFLTSLLGVTKPEEDISISSISQVATWATVSVALCSVGEVAMYFIYNVKVPALQVFLK